MSRRLRRIRHAHGTSLRVVADRVGISPPYLAKLETGKRALDRHCLIVALAGALGTSPSELIRLPVPAPGNGGADSAIEAVRHALLAVGHRRPGGEVVPGGYGSWEPRWTCARRPSGWRTTWHSSATPRPRWAWRCVVACT